MSSRVVYLSELEGEELVRIEGCVCESREIKLVTLSGRTFVMKHQQECCEDVSVEEVNGSPQLLLMSKLTRCYITSNRLEGSETQQWTFYTIENVHTTVVIRWYGISNGYYSTEVDLYEILEEQ